MMKKIILLILFTFFLIFGAFAQQRAQNVRGRLVDLKTQRPLENAHVINMTSLNGSVSNAAGFFTLTALPTDTLYISMIGYKSLTVPINVNYYNREYTSFYLVPEQYNLSEVIVRSNYLTGILEVDVRGLNPLFVEKVIDLPDVKTAEEINKKSLGSLGKPSMMQPVEYIYSFFSDEKKLKRIKQNSDISRMLNMKYDREFLMKSMNLTSEQLEELLLFCNSDPKWVVKASDLEVLNALLRCQEELQREKDKK